MPHFAATPRALALLLCASASVFSTASAPSTAAPVVPTLPSGDRIELWNGRDLTGWKLVLKDAAADPSAAWSTSDGVLRLHGGFTGYLRTETAWSDYQLHVEWRWPADAPPKSNSGVLIHLRGEDRIWPACVQVQQKIGSAGQLIDMETELAGFPVVSGQHRAPLLAAPSEHPLGEWNTCDIDAGHGTLVVRVNDVLQNRIENLPVSAGAVGLQLEGQPIEFRNFWLLRR